MRDDGYKQWRRRWLQWHSRSLLANALVLQRTERDTYLDEMLRAYLAHGDFTENEIDYIFRKVCHCVRKFASHLDASAYAQHAQERIRAQGFRLMTDASEVISQD